MKMVSMKKTDEEETNRIRKERLMMQEFRVLSTDLLIGRDVIGAAERNVWLYFIQQHYRMPTRLLDWTNSPLAALYFSASSSRDDDGEFFLMGAYEFTIIRHANQIAKEIINKERSPYTYIFTFCDPRFVKALSVIVDWEAVENFPDYIMAVRPDHFDRRVSLQSSCFTFHVPKEKLISKENFPNLNDCWSQLWLRRK